MVDIFDILKISFPNIDKLSIATKCLYYYYLSRSVSKIENDQIKTK